MRYQSYLHSAKKIIESNRGEVPFSIFLKKYFAASKKYGSRDRKQIASLCYNFYRLGKSMPGAPIEEKIITATFLCEQSFSDFLEFHQPALNEVIERPLQEKLGITGFDIADVFPYKKELSAGVEQDPFCRSFLDQPSLFLRIRPGKKNAVIKKLQNARLEFDMHGEDCIVLPNATKLGTVLEADKEVVIQDLHSQSVLDILKNEKLFGNRSPVSTWDCCAASGGKSILAYDILQGKIELTISDIRESILVNLKKRFSSAGIKNYKSFIADLSSPGCHLPDTGYQLIICDAPCTGSGTWGRTPEQLYFFNEEMIDIYAEKQEKIVSNIMPGLRKDGLFIYITCSVFRKENEEMVTCIKEKFHLELVQMELLKGYDKKADSMFTAAFIKK